MDGTRDPFDDGGRHGTKAGCGAPNCCQGCDGHGDGDGDGATGRSWLVVVAAVLFFLALTTAARILFVAAP